MASEDQDPKDETIRQLRTLIADNPLDEISVTSAALGAVAGMSLVALPLMKFKPIAVYMVSLSVFHFLEFYVTARYNSSKVNKDSFLINNGAAYVVAHGAALAEAYAESYLCAGFKASWPALKVAGFAMVVAGQVMRTMAMVTAGRSFSHLVSVQKRHDHTLVQDGVYALCRHPSYAGFFYWALGTQLMLLNPVCAVAFAAALYVFFSRRIRFEEAHLVAFFGDEYVRYRARTGTWIPFI